MTTPQFKPGDKVRRKPEWQDKNTWQERDKVLTVKSVFSIFDLAFHETGRKWCMSYFELAESQPYTIQAKDFDPTKQERQGRYATTAKYFWTSIPTTEYPPDSWHVVRDIPAPPKQLSLQEYLSMSNNLGLAGNQIADKLIAEGYATEFPNQQAS